MSSDLVYYSTYTKLAYDINEEFYKGIHYAWCCPFFFQPGHPPSSTPKEIYSLLSKDVKNLDRHSAKIRENATGIMKGAKFKMSQGIITPAQFQEIRERVYKGRQLADFQARCICDSCYG